MTQVAGVLGHGFSRHDLTSGTGRGGHGHVAAGQPGPNQPADPAGVVAGGLRRGPARPLIGLAKPAGCLLGSACCKSAVPVLAFGVALMRCPRFPPVLILSSASLLLAACLDQYNQKRYYAQMKPGVHAVEGRVAEADRHGRDSPGRQRGADQRRRGLHDQLLDLPRSGRPRQRPRAPSPSTRNHGTSTTPPGRPRPTTSVSRASSTMAARPTA